MSCADEGSRPEPPRGQREGEALLHGRLVAVLENDRLTREALCAWLLEAACAKAGIALTLRMQDGYDHSYFFISTFMDDHLRWHAERLADPVRGTGSR